MSYKKKFAEKFILPIENDDVLFYKSDSSLIHIFVPRQSGSHKSVCGLHLKNTFEVTEPAIVADVCAKCLKDQYAFDQASPFYTALWVELFNDYTSDGTKRSNPEVDLDEILQSQLDYELLSIQVQNEIRQCNHAFLQYLMRYNSLTKLECHNCQQEISQMHCDCVDPMLIDFVDMDDSGEEVKRDAFCMRCNGYLIRDVDKLL
ncbi:MAG: hypothetical protein INQ03_14695 [Candidatus Heimdallarchaeota archaeon]|nr:hypothetical protein [Candidatus Heimdallarchaeota archaeon]